MLICGLWDTRRRGGVTQEATVETPSAEEAGADFGATRKGLLGLWHRTPLYLRIIGGLILGLVAGVTLGRRAALLEIPSKMILRVLNLLAPPLILLAVMQALTHFAYLMGQGCFRTADLLADVRQALEDPGYRMSQLRYDLGKLRGKGLVKRRPRTQRSTTCTTGSSAATASG